MLIQVRFKYSVIISLFGSINFGIGIRMTLKQEIKNVDSTRFQNYLWRDM